MGAFHEGHLSLMRAAKKECGFCVCSLFVNPTQFGPAEDLNNYPRNETADFAMASDAGVDVMFAPSVDEMYAGGTTKVVVSGGSQRWEGEHRPGHFDGVATVVAKLFNIVRPDYAFFGLKDFQQCAVVDRLVRDLNYRIVLRFMDTVRELDGLAMSSRNAYLSPAERQTAPELHRALEGIAGALAQGDSIESSLAHGRERLASHGFTVEYLALVDPITLEPVNTQSLGDRLIVAAKLGKTRLIDNFQIT